MARFAEQTTVEAAYRVIAEYLDQDELDIQMNLHNPQVHIWTI